MTQFVAWNSINEFYDGGLELLMTPALHASALAPSDFYRTPDEEVFCDDGSIIGGISEFGYIW